MTDLFFAGSEIGCINQIVIGRADIWIKSTLLVVLFLNHFPITHNVHLVTVASFFNLLNFYLVINLLMYLSVCPCVTKTVRDKHVTIHRLLQTMSKATAVTSGKQSFYCVLATFVLCRILYLSGMHERWQWSKQHPSWKDSDASLLLWCYSNLPSFSFDAITVLLMWTIIPDPYWMLLYQIFSNCLFLCW